MRSIFTVETPASSVVLLTTAEAKAALGITDNSRDSDVDSLVAKISAAITNYCNWRKDGIHRPSLLSESLKDVFRLDCQQKDGRLMLSRRFVSEVTLLTEAGVELTQDTDFTIDASSGIISRLGGDNDIGTWPKGVIVAEYDAGFLTVPLDLKLAVEQWMRTLWALSYKSPSTITTSTLKVEDIPGVRRVEYSVPSSSSSSGGGNYSNVPDEITSLLNDGGYVDKWLA